HRRQDAHVPLVVRPGRYEPLVDTLEETLRQGGIRIRRRAGPSVLTIPARLLARIAGRGIARMVPDRLVELRGREVTVAVYPTDLALTGSAKAVARARGLVARDVKSTDAWFTTTKEAQEVEDRMAALETAEADAREAALPELDRKLLDLTIDQDTFEVLYRRRLQLAVPPQLELRDEREPVPPVDRPPRRVDLGAVVGISLAIMAGLDVVLTALAARRGRA
ncbi:MAG: hypothetical protein ABI620_09350, partial [Chloroflexota bacterium]